MCQRENLNFQKEAEEQFSFLEKEYEFSLKSSDLYRVEFVSKDVRIVILHDRLSYCLDVDFHRLNESISDMGASLYIFLLAKNKSDEIGHWPFQVSNDSNVLAKFIERLAILTKKHAEGLILGDRDSYLLCDSYEERISEIDEIDELKPAALMAWKQKQYKKLIQIYDEIGVENLSDADKKRLTIAKRYSTSSLKNYPLLGRVRDFFLNRST